MFLVLGEPYPRDSIWATTQAPGACWAENGLGRVSTASPGTREHMRLQGEGELKAQVQCRFLTGRQYLDGQRAQRNQKGCVRGQEGLEKASGVGGGGIWGAVGVMGRGKASPTR